MLSMVYGLLKVDLKVQRTAHAQSNFDFFIFLNIPKYDLQFFNQFFFLHFSEFCV